MLASLLGGALIALSLGLMLLGTGRIAGLSGVLAGVLRGQRGDWAWRALFLAGMIAGGLAAARFLPGAYDTETRAGLGMAAVSGLLVGLGTRLANGCTSGHGVCGMSRLSKRSFVATAVFFGVGVITATVVGHFLRSGA